DEGYFARAGRGEVFGFPHNGFETTAAESSTKLRDNAKRTGVIAAFGDFKVSLMFRRGDHTGCEIVIEKSRRFRRKDLLFALDGFKDAFDFASADDGVDFRNLLEDLIAIASDKASGDDEAFGCPEFLVFGHFKDGVDGFFLCRLDKAAGVDDQDFG